MSIFEALSLQIGLVSGGVPIVLMVLFAGAGVGTALLLLKK